VQVGRRHDDAGRRAVDADGVVVLGPLLDDGDVAADDEAVVLEAPGLTTRILALRDVLI